MRENLVRIHVAWQKGKVQSSPRVARDTSRLLYHAYIMYMRIFAAYIHVYNHVIYITSNNIWAKCDVSNLMAGST